MTKSELKTVKFPVSILKELQKEFPQSKNPERIRRMYESHVEMKVIKSKITNAGKFLYGQAWEKRYGKK